MKVKLPVRLEAWEAEEKIDGWAVATEDLVEYLDKALINSASYNELVDHMKRLLEHLKYSGDKNAKLR